MNEWYLAANLSLVVSYGMFQLVQKALAQTRLQVGFRTWLRWGQLLLVLSFTVPLVISLLPRQSTSGLSAIILPPLSEEDTPSIASTNSPFLPNPVIEKIPDAAINMGHSLWSVVESYSHHLTWVLLLAIALSIVLKVRAVLQVRTLLKRSICIRHIGKITIAASSEITVPFSALMAAKAWVVVPESLLVNWTDFKLALKHELQHHRQRDTAWAIFIEGFTAFFFLNPFTYLWKRKICEFQEFSCDETLIGHNVSAYEYGSCLVRVAEAALENCNALVGTTGMAAGSENPIYFKSFLRRRIEMLAKHTQKKSSRWVGFFIGTLTMVSTFAFALSADQIMGSKLDSPANENVNPGEVVTEPEIQKIADRALNAALKRHKATLGFIVVSDAATGRLLAVANKDLIETEFERSPHWALSLKMGPHSLAKAIVASAAVEKKVTSFDEVHNCEMGKYNFGGKVYQDWKPFDKLSTADLLAHSSNICGIKVGQKLGAQGISQALKNFGFGAGGSAKDFPEAREGEIPAPSTDEPLYISTILTGYGGIYVSPIEIVQAFGAIANGGNLLKPQTAKSSVEPIVVRRILSEETARKTREVLATVMTKGTARSSGSKLYRLAGKTATGYSRTHAEHDTLGGESNMASFAGFGPVEKPRVVIYVGIENPHDGKGVHGSYHAAPVFREVAEKTLRYLKVPVASAH